MSYFRELDTRMIFEPKSPAAVEFATKTAARVEFTDKRRGLTAPLRRGYLTWDSTNGGFTTVAGIRRPRTST